MPKAWMLQNKPTSVVTHTFWNTIFEINIYSEDKKDDSFYALNVMRKNKNGWGDTWKCQII